MLRAQREKILKELTEELKRYNVVYFVDFQGLTVEEMTKLRREFRKNDVKFRVVKNTLVRIAHERAERPVDENVLAGSTAVALTEDDPIAPAKVIKEFLKEHEKPQVKAIEIGDKFYGPDKFEEFASMPGLEELRAKLVGSLNSPIYGLVFVLAGLMRGLVTQLDQLAKQRQEQG